jgi:hypothetical protein
MRFLAVPCALRLRVTGGFALVAMEEWASLIGPRGESRADGETLHRAARKSAVLQRTRAAWPIPPVWQGLAAAICLCVAKLAGVASIPDRSTAHESVLLEANARGAFRIAPARCQSPPRPDPSEIIELAKNDINNIVFQYY